jgi:hypothetical protein
LLLDPRKFVEDLRAFEGIVGDCGARYWKVRSFDPRFPEGFSGPFPLARGEKAIPPLRYVTINRSVAPLLSDWFPLPSEMFRLAEKF